MTLRLKGLRVGLVPAIRQRYVALADERGCQLQVIHAEAVSSFVSARVVSMQRGSSYAYLVTPRQHENHNVRLTAELHDQVLRLARLDGVSARVFLHNALSSYADILRPSDP